MANNRMLFVHIPTGKAVYIAKRMGSGWYNVPDDIKSRLETLFDETEFEGQDNFAIAMEVTENAPYAFADWDYTRDDELLKEMNEKGIQILQINPKKGGEEDGK